MAKTKKAQDQALEVQNAAKTLLANIRFMSVDKPVRSIVMTSSVPNEGKTFVTVNLAQAIATSGKTVLLVEGDMRRRSCANSMGVHPKVGLYSVLSGQSSLTTAIVGTPQNNFFFLDAEPHIPNPPDILSSKRFAELLQEALDSFDYVVFDTPPVGAFVDAAVLSHMCDATFLVVREDYTKKPDIAASAEQLVKAGGNLAGVVMNACESKGSEYYYEYYNDSDGSKKDVSPISLPQEQPAPQPARSYSRPAPAARRAVPAADSTAEYVLEANTAHKAAMASAPRVRTSQVSAPKPAETPSAAPYTRSKGGYAPSARNPYLSSSDDEDL